MKTTKQRGGSKSSGRQPLPTSFTKKKSTKRMSTHVQESKSKEYKVERAAAAAAAAAAAEAAAASKVAGEEEVVTGNVGESKEEGSGDGSAGSAGSGAGGGGGGGSGWVRHWDVNQKKHYFHHRQTRTTTWTEQEVDEDQMNDGLLANESLAKDEKTGREYAYNTKTRETRWLNSV